MPCNPTHPHIPLLRSLIPIFPPMNHSIPLHSIPFRARKCPQLQFLGARLNTPHRLYTLCISSVQHEYTKHANFRSKEETPLHFHSRSFAHRYAMQNPMSCYAMQMLCRRREVLKKATHKTRRGRRGVCIRFGIRHVRCAVVREARGSGWESGFEKRDGVCGRD
ncbi:hypothetical protein BCR34DRAFT_361295 [Clohesyomyces aquaticus]|uniref:Uncharacterized protein n=1 Tax=Clohesyomyces aquaticus TaxID=1231657 RepID=A0A1Y2A7A7_9PLEO|nr:hypothetical protein BCR34DRAFT_361295 [Clohesyomyces aquaticus]